MKLPTLALLALLLATTAPETIAADRPNIVWILSEDNSKHYLKLFDEHGAETPNIEALAAEGLTFTRAFSNGAVCSVARTTLATGCYAPRIGTQYHRKVAPAHLPGGLRMFPALLRDAGYYTTNNSKKDYNAVEGEGVWDESSKKATWRKRPEGEQPFFHMETHTESHEGKLHFDRATFENEKTDHDPAGVFVPPGFPDTELMRYTIARYLDRMQIIDERVGETIAKLEEDGLLEDTFVFYFGDHGGVLPFSKGYPYETGLHVPLVVRVPEKWKHLVDAERGTEVGGFVSFVDFGPTVLNLAGVEVPAQMDGEAFLGEGVSLAEVRGRDFTYSHADRFDEKYDFRRAIRVGDYKYIRNYEPLYPDALQNNYRYEMLAYREIRRLHREGQLGDGQRFFQRKAPEELYDLSGDPYEMENLAGDDQHRDTLAELRERLREFEKQLPDLSFFPESVLVREALDDPAAYGQEHRERIAALLDTADLALHPFPDAAEELGRALVSSDPLRRYWGAKACTSFGEGAADLAERALPLLEDENNLVRIAAAEFLGSIGKRDPRPALTGVLNTTSDPVEALIALNTIVHFHDADGIAYPFQSENLDPLSPKPEAVDDQVQRRLDYLKGETER